MRCSGCVALVFLLAASTASAQVKETIDVHLVEVPVTVIDHAGNPIRGLTPANFELFDQGTRQAISSFDVIDFASADITRNISPLNPSARRNFVLLFDLSFSSPAGRNRARNAARNFIARGMGPRDLAAVATIDVDHGFRMVTSLTTDRNLLGAAIASPRNFVSSDPLGIAGNNVLEVLPVDTAPSSNSKNTNDDLKDIALGEKKLNDQYSRARIERQLHLLGDLGRTLRVLPGRKQVIFFSEGFDPRLVRGRDAHALSDEQDDMQQTTEGNVWRVDNDTRYGSSMTMTLLAEMARTLRGSDVVLHAVDIQGVRVQSDENGAHINSNDALYLLSQPTGGEVFKNSNDMNADLERMLRSQDVVYVLGFHAPAAKDGKFHELKVRVTGVAGARVFHRAGYYESGKESGLERSLSNAEIILNDLPENDVGVSILAAAFPRSGSAAVPMVIDIAGEGLTRDAKARQIVAEVYVYAFDEQGVARDRSYQRLTIDGAKLAGHLGIKYFSTLNLSPGKYQVKALVRVAGTDHKGFARTDVDVPATYDVALLPPMFLDNPASWIVVREASHEDASPYPFHINGEPFMPSASASVANGTSRRVAVFVFNAEPDELAWETGVTDARGDSHASEPALVTRLRGQGVMKLVFDYAPTDLQSGPAIFGVTVHKKGSGDARKSSVPMVVQ